MQKSKYIWIGFALMVLLQIAAPAFMIMEQHTVMEDGFTHKFNTAPVDPNDIYRGKYVALAFEDNIIDIENVNDWNRSETAFLTFQKDSLGYSVPKAIFNQPPTDTEDYLSVKITNVFNSKLRFEYPFRRYYMEESKALKAEEAYVETLSERKEAYAVVRIKEGQYYFSDLIIDGAPILEFLRNNDR